MSQRLDAGDFLVFQLEAGYGLLRLLETDEANDGKVWHLIAYNDLFPDVDSAEAAALAFENLVVSEPHLALTDRAFESTQVARIANRGITEPEAAELKLWRRDPNRQVSDRSVRLMLGLR